MVDVKEPLFPLGQIGITPGAEDALTRADVAPETLLMRHQHGDWGDIPQEDAQVNQVGLERDCSIMSVYRLESTGETIWIYTADDRSYTNIMLPSEY